MTPGSVDCLCLADSMAVTRVAAETLVQAVRMAVAQRDRAFVAVSGGSTPAPLYRLLASSEYDAVVPWERLHLLWVDERLVPPDDPASNYRLVADSGLLDRPLAGVHRMPGERSPQEAERSYAALLGELWPDADPALDVALLGMGDDGHTASLFPGSPVLGEEGRAVAAVEEHAGFRRLTLTLPTLRRTRRLVFLVSGAGKAEALGAVLGEDGSHLPAAVVSRAGRRVLWLVDREAAAGLEASRTGEGARSRRGDPEGAGGGPPPCAC